MLSIFTKLWIALFSACKKNCLSCYFDEVLTSICISCAEMYVLNNGECLGKYIADQLYKKETSMASLMCKEMLNSVFHEKIARVV